jgi:hypothetical protein
MKTETQLRAEFYTAIASIVTVSWLSKPTSSSTFPLATYQILDASGEYSFGVTRSAEDRTFQVDLYVEPSDVVNGDNKLDAIKTALEAINYRQAGSQAEFLETDLNKVIKVTRWERYNV